MFRPELFAGINLCIGGVQQALHGVNYFGFQVRYRMLPCENMSLGSTRYSHRVNKSKILRDWVEPNAGINVCHKLVPILCVLRRMYW